MSKVSEKSVCLADSPAVFVSGVPELRPSVDSQLTPNSSGDLSIELRRVEALETIGSSLKSVSSFLAGTTLPAVLQTLAVNGAAQTLLGGLTSNAGRKGLDALTMNQNAIDIAHLIEKVFVELSRHGASRQGIKDGEELMGVRDDSDNGV